MLCASGAIAQSIPCGDRADIVDRLKNIYAEKPTSIGVTANGAIIEVYVSEDGTFSVLVTAPTGGSCLVASGQSWEQLPIVTAEKGIGL